MLSFFLAEPGDKLASEVFYIFQMACDLNCTAEGICWDHIIYYQIMRSEMKAYIYKLFILLTLRKSKCSQLHLWQVRFCFVLSSLHLYGINSELQVLALSKTVAVTLSDTEVQFEFCFTGWTDTITAIKNIREGLYDFLEKGRRKRWLQNLSWHQGN